MSHSPSQIRQALAAAITAAAGPGRVWHEVPIPADLYESLAPELGEEMAQHGFAVGVPDSDPMPQGRGSLLVSTTCEIAWSRILGAERQILDYDAALVDEQHLLGVALALGGSGRNAALSSIARKATSGGSVGLIIGRIRIKVPHVYPL